MTMSYKASDLFYECEMDLVLIPDCSKIVTEYFDGEYGKCFAIQVFFLKICF